MFSDCVIFEHFYRVKRDSVRRKSSKMQREVADGAEFSNKREGRGWAQGFSLRNGQ